MTDKEHRHNIPKAMSQAEFVFVFPSSVKEFMYEKQNKKLMCHASVFPLKHISLPLLCVPPGPDGAVGLQSAGGAFFPGEE